MKDKNKFKARVNKMLDESLISIEYLKASSLVDWNVTPEKILPYIIEAQELKLEPLIGTKLYRKLQENSLTFEYELLLDKYVMKYLLHQALSSYLKVAAYNVQQGGIYRHNPTDADPVEHFEISLLVKNEQYKSDEYSKRMVNFLKKYPTYYPEYLECVGDGIAARRGKRVIVGGWGLQRTLTKQDKEEVSNDLWASDKGCCGETASGGCTGSDCPPDASIFTTNFYWGNSEEVAMGFDPTTLDNDSNVQPISVTAQPLNDYFWIVSENDFDVAQVGIVIPSVDFSDPNANTEIFVKGTDANYTWMRIKIREVYESAVVFEIV